MRNLNKVQGTECLQSRPRDKHMKRQVAALQIKFQDHLMETLFFKICVDVFLGHDFDSKGGDASSLFHYFKFQWPKTR